MRKKHYVIIVSLIGFLWCHDGLCASDRVALVIGNKDYQDAPLKNPVNDANDFSEMLEELGFEVIKRTNLTYQAMKRALRDFSQTIPKNGVALFYFAGHGVQMSGINYLLPVGQRIDDPEDIPFESVQADHALAKMEAAGSKVNIVILDACRNNPSRGFRSVNQGLAPMNAEGAFIAYATGPGRFALDNARGRNGLYTKKLLETLKTPGLTIEELFRRVRYHVSKESDKQQIPWTASGLYGEKPFYFIPPTSNPPQGNPNPGTVGKRIGKYIDHGNGTITDTESGLMWKRCSEGLSGVNCEKGKVKKSEWFDTKRFKNVGYAGHTDWRLPTIEELETLVYCTSGVKNKDKGACNEGSEKPTINQQAFPNTEEFSYWTKSLDGIHLEFAWHVNFDSGRSYRNFIPQPPIANFPVRLVRGEKKIGKYIDNRDGTITDTETKLMWKRCSEGLFGENCEKGKAKEYEWDDAVKRFKNVSYAGYRDWRLPTIDELKTLVYCSEEVKDKKRGRCNDGSTKPTINQQAFPNTTRWYWSGSPYADFSVSAWGVGFGSGSSYNGNRNYNYAVRLVRGGQ
ncbi:MAG: DUF1566 domain-containing protein [Candidatus Electrothrix sp. AW5]|nr:DUF1566 domain-containing protein [Candidatus Electrothrix gigas]